MLKGWMYILECSDGSYYTGSTNHMERRLMQHQQGEGANYTKNRRPVKLVYCEEFSKVDDAFYREKQVQGWSRAKKKALIDGCFDDLPALSTSTKDSTGSSTSSVIEVTSLAPELVEGEIEKQIGAILSLSKNESIVSSDNAKALGNQADD